MRPVLVAAAIALDWGGLRRALAEPVPRLPATVYATTCGYCHGANVGPLILGRHLSASLIKTLVRQGPNAMPAFRPTEISDVELEALAQWIEVSAPSNLEHGQ